MKIKQLQFSHYQISKSPKYNAHHYRLSDIKAEKDTNANEMLKQTRLFDPTERDSFNHSQSGESPLESDAVNMSTSMWLGISDPRTLIV